MPRTTERRSPIAPGGRRPGVLDQAPGLLRVLAVERRVGHAEAHRQRDQPRLRPVVQVALEAAQLGRRVVDQVGPGLGQHLHPLLERLGAAVAEEPPVEHRPRLHQRRRHEPPDEAGHDPEQQHDHDQRHRDADDRCDQQPPEVAPRHRVGEHRACLDEEPARRQGTVRRGQGSAEGAAGHRPVQVRDPAGRGQHGHEDADPDPDDDEHAADGPEHEQHDHQDREEELGHGVPGQQEAAWRAGRHGSAHGPILSGQPDLAQGCRHHHRPGLCAPDVRRLRDPRLEAPTNPRRDGHGHPRTYSQQHR